MTLAVDVCVVGGGPGGATTAAALARVGRRVALVEQRPFPRDHVGESLSPGFWPLLGSVGLPRSAVEDIGVPVRMASIRWRSPEEELTAVDGGLTVDRAAFDARLLDHARASGVEVVTGRARRPARTSTGWRLSIGSASIEASMLADATGRVALLGGRRIRTAPRTLALHARWRPDRVPDAPQTRVCALADGWAWCARLPGGDVRAMIFVDPDRLGSGGHEPGRLFRRLVGSVDAPGPLLADLPEGTAVGVCDASSYRLDEVVTPDSVRVGEAAFAIDPLSSCGVQTAVQSGLAAAATIHTLLSPDGDRAAALEYYADLVHACVRHHRATAGGLYAEHDRFADRRFWRDRSGSAAPVPPVASRLKPAELLPFPVRLRSPAELRVVACRVGDRIERCRALCRPGWDRPVGFLGGLPVGSLVDELHTAASLGVAVSSWERSLPAGRAARILSWFLDHGLLEPVDA
ncbi:MAG: NAD(P)/FAD-dependent oxidoreductase [Actinomycetes bacterium]